MARSTEKGNFSLTGEAELVGALASPLGRIKVSATRDP
jgi:hypothetical protein